MGVEIERKFLVAGDEWRAGASPGTRYRQGYLATNALCSVRVRVGGNAAYLNIKGATKGATRLEFEYPLPLRDAEEMLGRLAGALVEKTRYVVAFGAHTWEIDMFEGANDGLVVAEIELGREDEDFARPAWLGQEVTNEQRYYNAALAQHPYAQWKK